MKACLALVALAGCASALPKRSIDPEGQAHTERHSVTPMTKPEASEIQTTLAGGEQRPEVRASIEIDAASLPVGTWGALRPGAAFNMTTDPPEFHIGGMRFAEVSVGSFTAFTDTAVSTAKWPQCHRLGGALAVWRGLSLDEWSEDSIAVVMTRGPFDFVSCTAKPEASLIQRAVGIVPGFVYAVRVDDVVYVVLPHASFVSAAHNAAGSGPFSSATLPCKPHHESAAAMRIATSSLTRWQEISTYGPWADPGRVSSDDPIASLLVIVEVRARGDRNIVSVSAAVPHMSGEDVYAPFFDAMKRAGARG